MYQILGRKTSMAAKNGNRRRETLSVAKGDGDELRVHVTFVWSDGDLFCRRNAVLRGGDDKLARLVLAASKTEIRRSIGAILRCSTVDGSCNRHVRNHLFAARIDHRDQNGVLRICRANAVGTDFARSQSEESDQGE